MEGLVSSERVLEDLRRRYVFSNASWRDTALEAIPMALGIMRPKIPVCGTSKEVLVSNYKAILPCSPNTVYAVEYKDYRVILRGTKPMFKGRDNRADLQYHPSLEAHLQAGTLLFTGLENGTVTIWYYDYPRTEEGYPLLPDSEKLMQALFWYCSYDLMFKDYIKNAKYNIEECYQKFEYFYPMAKNDLKFPTPDNYATMAIYFTNPFNVDINNNFLNRL